MLDESFWLNKFSVGLALDTTYEDFSALLDRYAKFIDNFYLSLPLGDRFHGRDLVAKQLKDPETIKLFWKMVDCIKEHGINIEIVFNTYFLEDGDFALASSLMDSRDLYPDKIGILDKYYARAKETFPHSKIINSVNNMPNTLEAFKQITNQYDEIVIGRHFIRDKEIFKFVKEKLGAKSILLINNGCSHTCGGCDSIEYCRSVYERDSRRFSNEYIYALQSILPYEFHDKYFSFDDVSYFKLSTRNANTDYIRKCLDSYIYNRSQEYVNLSCKNYIIWSRLAWNVEHFPNFNYDRIMKTKQDICRKLNPV